MAHRLTAAMSSVKQNLEKILELVPVTSNRFITRYLPSAPVGARGTFGGTLVAQSLLASLHTVPINFHPTSLHCYFINGGDPRSMITYEVKDLRTGKNFIHKQVRAYQHEKLVFATMILFSVKRSQQHDSLHHLKRLKEIPEVEQYKDAAELFKSEVIGKFVKYQNMSPEKFKNVKFMDKYVESFEEGPMEYRFPSDFFHSTKETDHLDYCVRIRTPVVPEASEEQLEQHASSHHFHGHGKIPDKITPANDPRYNYVAFAYLSDSYILLTIPYFHKLPLYCHQFSVSLDHVIHFHQQPRVNEWIHQDITNPRSNFDKHLVQGEYYDSTGEIIASVSQEGFVVYDSEASLRARL
ncbi:Peroxisomal acyl-coenzyme A thioester hydrolase 1 [Nakaseomyces bracarensis]|uniref:Peroxisomal acyl-coenzyme A thioester hydrolase 1 n=1 Tax=Nakaseomyces bracarensis TaxID=273131 RepID=A0ABR4NR10_9SACH